MLKNICLFVVICSIFLFKSTDGIAVMSVDLGSEWIKIAIVKPGVPMEIALNKESRRKTPFVISMKGNEREFGDPAYTVAIKQPAKAYIYLTHLLGKKFDSPAVQLYKNRFPFYNLLKDEERGTVLFEGENGQKHSVEELLGMMLNNTRQIAENFADHPMKDIVLTVPVYFNQAERKALLDATNMIGMNVLQLINDNTAVALNYGIFRAATFNATVKNVMFYDMGASHTTVTIVSYSTTKVKDRGYLETVPQLVVKGVGFDTTLGGLEMDMRLRDHFVKAFKAAHKTKNDITANQRAMAKLLKEAKRVRQVLSANADHVAQIENVFEEIDFKQAVTRAELIELCADLYERVKEPVKMALNAAAMTLDDIETVILMGGGTRIPRVQELLLEAVKKEELGKNINTDEAAALGAVYKAADLTAGFKVKRFLVKDLNLFPVDVQFERTSTVDDGAVKIINRNLYHRLNPLPQKKIMTFNKKPNDFTFNVTYGDLTFLSKDLHSSLDLDQISHVELSGVDAAHDKNTKGTPKGVKAFFHLDESGVLHVEKVEAHFEKTPEIIEEESQSTFAKLGSKLSSFFGSGKESDETVETPKEEESKESDKKKEDNKGQEESKKEESASKKEEDVSGEKTKDKNEKTDEKPKADKIKVDNATSTNTTNGNGTEEVKSNKPVIVKEEIQFVYHVKDIPVLTKTKFEESKKKLDDLEARDQAKFATERMHNNLESYIFEFRDKLYEENVQQLSTETEREKIEKSLSEASEWLDEEGFAADEQTLKKKLKSLKELTEELQFRIDEQTERPKAIESMLQSLNLTDMFFGSLKALPDAKEIYSEKDLKDLEKIKKDAKEWLMTNWQKQNESDSTKKPVMLTKDILYQQGKVDRELMYLINKAKYYVPKPKPKPNATESNATKSKESNATKSKGNETDTKEGEKLKSESEQKSNKTEPEPDVKSDKKSETGDEKKETDDVVLELGDGQTSDEKDTKKEDDSTDSKNEKKLNTDSNEQHQPIDEL